MKSRLRSLILAGICLAAVSLIETAAGSVFVPSPSELDRAVQANPDARVDVSALVPQVDETGRRFFEVDDMRYSADAVEIDSAFSGNNWPGGVVYYQFNPAVTTTHRQAWRSAAATWSAVATVSFVESTGSGNYISVQNSSGNNSFIGMVGGPQTMNLLDWGYQEVIVHEIGHALGLIHEHCRPNRGSYVTILYANIQAGHTDNFDIEPGAVTFGAYDFDSIMHYFSTSFSSNGQNTIVPLPAYASHLATMGRALHLSATDAAGMAQRYGSSGATRPANDNFAARIALLNASGSINGSSAGGTKEASEPNHGGNIGGKSIWYSWTAPGTGTATIDTVQSGFDTLLGVYTGNSVGALTLVASNDDISTSTNNLQSRVTFAATSGVLYRIAVDGYNGVSGSVHLHWSFAGAVGPATQICNFNGDAKPDYVLYSATTGQTLIWYLNDNLYMGGHYGPILPTGWRLASVADVDGNGTSDYLLFHPASRQTAIWFMSGPSLTRTAYGPTLPSGYELAATADFNADGKPDYLLYNASTRGTAVWFLNGNVHVCGGYGPTVPVGWRIADAADFDRDGHPDWVLDDSASHRTAIWYFNGVALTRTAYGPTLTSGYQLAAATDFNGDAKPDYLLYNGATRQTVLWYMSNNAFLNTVFGPTVAAGYTLAAP